MPYFQRIIDVVHENGDSIARNWTEAAYQRHLVHGIPDEKVDWQPIVEANLEAIRRADVVIAESTYYTFSQGFQVATALRLSKPVLVLTRNQFKARTFSGYESALLEVVEYSTKTDVAHAVNRYLQGQSEATRTSMTLSLSPQVQRYLSSIDCPEAERLNMVQDLLHAGLKLKMLMDEEQ